MILKWLLGNILRVCEMKWFRILPNVDIRISKANISDVITRESVTLRFCKQNLCYF
jgi:hypothetical protein